MNLCSKIVNHLRWMTGLTAEQQSKRALRKLHLGPQHLILDCGANVGEITEEFAKTGAEVHAFEPNPFAYAELKKRCGQYPRVVCHQAAVGCQAGRQRLYFHEQSDQDEVLYSNGSSLLAEKPNISLEKSIEVEMVDLAEFLRRLPRDVDVMKMDIEGAEVAVLEHLIATGTIRRVRRAFIETHEKKIPSLAPGTARLKTALKNQTHCEVHWDWV